MEHTEQVAAWQDGDAPGCASRFAEALQHHQAGRLQLAADGYQQILAVDPGHADSLHLLGLITYQRGHKDAAINLVERAIALKSGAAPFHSNLGNMLRDQGRLAEAVACYHQALALQPDFADARYNLGMAFAQQGHLPEAVACCRKALALRPDYPGAAYALGGLLMRQGQTEAAIACYREAVALTPGFAWGHYSLAHALAQQGDPQEAIRCYQQAVALQPDFPEAQNNLGNLLKQQGRVAEAVGCYRKVLDARPDSAEVASNLGIALAEQGQLEEAVACYRQGLALRADSAELHNNLGHALEQQGRTEEALACFRRAVGLRPELASAQLNLGNALTKLRRLEEATACYRRAIALQPDYPEACNNLGNVLREQGQLQAAVAALHQAVALRPDFADAHANLGIALLALGEMAAGWEEYEWRWKTPPMLHAAREFAQPQWQGEPAAGRTLLVHAEQGLGDTVQFCRYVTMAAARGLRVFVEVQKPLVRLLGGLAGAAGVVARGEALPPFDLHCPMASLPRVFGTTVATIPPGCGYLQADAAQVAMWERRLGGLELPGGQLPGRDKRVGLVWAGSAGLPSDARRSLPPERLTPLFEVAGLRFCSLQKGGPSAPEAFPLFDCMARMQDLADTAALVGALDLVISVDTAVAHLAAALGKPVWLLNRFDADWRWLTERRDSPWYPTLRIYRQVRAGDWESVLAQVADDLRAFAAGVLCG